MFELYLISILDGIDKFFLVTGAISAIIGVFLLLFIICTSGLDEDNHQLMYIKYSKLLIIISLIAFLFNVLIPSSKDGYIIFGVGSVIEYMSENDNAKNIPDKTLQYINKLLDVTNDTIK